MSEQATGDQIDSGADRRLRELSPLRNTTTASTTDDLVEEQLAHFCIDPASDYGRALARLVERLYGANMAAHELWAETLRTLDGLDRRDRIAYFNAKRFTCFQLAKILDTMQNPLRRTYQSVVSGARTFARKGPYTNGSYY